MLTADEWDHLYAEHRRLSRRATSEQAELAIIESEIKAHSDGSDPLAPFGGIYPRGGDGLGIVWGLSLAYSAFRASTQGRRSRWLYSSLLANAGLLIGISGVLRLLPRSFLARWVPPLVHIGIIAGGLVLLLAAWAVLMLERRARRQECRRLAAGSVVQAAPLAAIGEERIPAESMVRTDRAAAEEAAVLRRAQ